MGEENDRSQAKDDAPLSNVSRGRYSRASHEATKYQARGCQSPATGKDGDTGEPDAVKAARPVRWGVVGKGLCPGYHPKGRPIGQVWDKKQHLVGYLPNYMLREVGKTLMQTGAKAVYPFTITRTAHSDDQ
jgi:hypothetical protein